MQWFPKESWWNSKSSYEIAVRYAHHHARRGSGRHAINEEPSSSTFPIEAIELTRGDITLEKADAIVNAANSSLLGGGGVDGAIHRAGGEVLQSECRQIRARQGGCKVGEAVITAGGNLPARWVIHTVGPTWRGGGHGEEDLLRSCYRSCLRIAREHQANSVAFPSISTGRYRYPIELAAAVAIEAAAADIANHSTPLLVRFVLFSQDDYDTYRRILSEFTLRSGVSK